ncbi:MAG: DNA repair protein RecO [bacterium]
MAILNSEGIVLKGWKFGETSEIVSILTKDFGKVRMIAKGSRSLKSKFKGCLEPLTYIHIIYYEKKTRDLQLLSKADLIDPHYDIIGNPMKTALAFATIELVEKIIEDENPVHDLFELLVDTLSSIDRNEKFMEGYFWFFEEHLIDIMGYKASWNSCLNCKKSLGFHGGLFQPDQGGLLCHDCSKNQGGLRISAETLEILYFLQKESLNHAADLHPGPYQIAEVRKMYDLYFKTHIEHMQGLRSLNLYYNLLNYYNV